MVTELPRICFCTAPGQCFGGHGLTLCRIKEQLSGDTDDNLFFWARRVSEKNANKEKDDSE